MEGDRRDTRARAFAECQGGCHRSGEGRHADHSRWPGQRPRRDERPGDAGNGTGAAGALAVCGRNRRTELLPPAPPSSPTRQRRTAVRRESRAADPREPPRTRDSIAIRRQPWAIHSKTKTPSSWSWSTTSASTRCGPRSARFPPGGPRSAPGETTGLPRLDRVELDGYAAAQPGRSDGQPNAIEMVAAALLDTRARMRVVLPPLRGGGASAYRAWTSVLRPDVQLCAVQLPGRENRLGEPLFTNVSDLVPPSSSGRFGRFSIARTRSSATAWGHSSPSRLLAACDAFRSRPRFISSSPAIARRTSPTGDAGSSPRTRRVRRRAPQPPGNARGGARQRGADADRRADPARRFPAVRDLRVHPRRAAGHPDEHLRRRRRSRRHGSGPAALERPHARRDLAAHVSRPPTFTFATTASLSFTQSTPHSGGLPMWRDRSGDSYRSRNRRARLPVPNRVIVCDVPTTHGSSARRRCPAVQLSEKQKAITCRSRA